MKTLILVLALFSARNAYSRYVIGMKDESSVTHKADDVCVNRERDSLTLVRKAEKATVPLDAVLYLTYRERKSWWPYLLTAAIVGTSTYTALSYFGKDDMMYTAEGKARFMGILSGTLVLGLGAVVKEAVETYPILNPRLEINDTGALLICDF